jgi:hypothetical protein
VTATHITDGIASLGERILARKCRQSWECLMISPEAICGEERHREGDVQLSAVLMTLYRSGVNSPLQDL